jgi:hypothetical protein
MTDMGKTVESYKAALESEINRWNGSPELCVKMTVKLSRR